MGEEAINRRGRTGRRIGARGIKAKERVARQKAQVSRE